MSQHASAFRLARPSCTLLVLLAVCVLSAGQVRAYGAGQCTTLFAQANVEKTTQFSINAGHADFGDDPHALGGPGGTAVICWSIDGRVAITGKLYADTVRDPVNVFARVRFYRRGGGTIDVPDVSVTGSFAASKVLNVVSNPGNYYSVRVRLYEFTDSDIAGPGSSRRLASKNYYR
jgi:hypothetical protein